jgi:hypothetical protein
MRCGHARRGGAAGDRARLKQNGALALGPMLVEKRKRRACRLASARRRNKDSA